MWPGGWTEMLGCDPLGAVAHLSVEAADRAGRMAAKGHRCTTAVLQMPLKRVSQERRRYVSDSRQSGLLVNVVDCGWVCSQECPCFPRGTQRSLQQFFDETVDTLDCNPSSLMREIAQDQKVRCLSRLLMQRGSGQSFALAFCGCRSSSFEIGRKGDNPSRST
jgi:hypothetical protein